MIRLPVWTVLNAMLLAILAVVASVGPAVADTYPGGNALIRVRLCQNDQCSSYTLASPIPKL